MCTAVKRGAAAHADTDGSTAITKCIVYERLTMYTHACVTLVYICVLYCSPSAWQQLHASKQETALQDVIGKEFVIELSSNSSSSGSSSSNDSSSTANASINSTSRSSSSSNRSSNKNALVYTVTAAAAPSPCSDLVQLLHTLDSA
jgi:hypothetical protein